MVGLFISLLNHNATVDKKSSLLPYWVTENNKKAKDKKKCFIANKI